jgi:hypothetical protein
METKKPPIWKMISQVKLSQMPKIHILIGSSYNNEISMKLKKKSLICNDGSMACPIPCQNQAEAFT